jgi:hypothetical protein
VQDAIDEGKVVEETGKYSSRTATNNNFLMQLKSLMLVLVVLVEMKKS